MMYRVWRISASMLAIPQLSDGTKGHLLTHRLALMPGCMASSTSRTFSAADHRRRRCTEVMTSNREIGPSEGVVIVVIIGLRLCLISYAECPVEKGGSSGLLVLARRRTFADRSGDGQGSSSTRTFTSRQSRSKGGTPRDY